MRALLLAVTAQDLLRGALSGCNRAVYGGTVTAQVGSFAGEIESFRDRFGEGSAARQRARRHVTVRSTREGVAIPIVEMRRFEKIGGAGGIGARDPGYGVQSASENVRFRLAE